MNVNYRYNIIIPWQVNPSPSYSASHSQANVSFVFLHVALGWQGFDKHSLMTDVCMVTTRIIINHTFLMN